MNFLTELREGLAISCDAIRANKMRAGLTTLGSVIGADLAKNFFAPGPAIGNKIKIDNSSFEVIGVVEKRGKFLGLENLDNTCYVPVTRFAAGFIFRPGVRITVKVGSMVNIDDAKEEIRGVMR